MIIMDFFTLRMPGILNRLSVSITYQPAEKKEVSISFGEALDWWQKNNTKPFVKFVRMPTEIILPGSFTFCFDWLLTDN